MSIGAKAGVGVGLAVVAIAAVGGLLLLLRRRKARKQTSTFDEKVELDVSSSNSKSGFDDKDNYLDSKDRSPGPVPTELGGDLHGPASELDSKGGSSEATELSTGKNH